jgi:hypothetical protein
MRSARLGICVTFLTTLLPAQEPAKPNLNIVIVEGEGAINNVRKRVAREVIVQVEDENHKPVAGASVVFLLPERGASAVFVNGQRSLITRTNEAGRAAIHGMKANNVPGQYQIRVTASFQGQTATASIAQTNALAAAAAGAGGAAGGVAAGMGAAKVIAIVAIVAGAAVGGGVAAISGGGSSSSSSSGSQTPGTSIRPGSPSVGPPK